MSSPLATTTTPNAPLNASAPLKRADTAQTMHPPGAWQDGPDDSTPYNAEQSPSATVGNTWSGALSAAGNMAATYLPANVVSSLAAYAPGIVPQSPQATSDIGGEAKKADPLTNSSAVVVPAHSLTSHPLPEPHEKQPLTAISPQNLTATSGNPGALDKIAPKDITSATAFASPSSFSPAPAETLPTTANISEGTPKLDVLSTTAVTGHSTPGIVAPPPSAATTFAPHSSTAPSRDTSLPSTFESDRSRTGSGATSLADPQVPPSSTLSMKSGVVGSGHLQQDATAFGKTLPTIPSPAAPNGVTPNASELEKEDLHYLAPAIRPEDSSRAVPTTAAASKPLDTSVGSKFTDKPTAISPQSAASGHARTGSASSSGSLSPGGSPKRKVGFVKKLKGEAKILKGKLTKDENKVMEGRGIISGEL
ncbi:hypothetical protein BKA62DRAFT_765986 [Auriculariales sp. MPI-PUGE-AT-0066]|nr:hypothetical protein BKA62DRAFT_765986 [Auriculariales sp. MPI-PUGE-AT-0066]